MKCQILFYGKQVAQSNNNLSPKPNVLRTFWFSNLFQTDGTDETKRPCVGELCAATSDLANQTCIETRRPW